MLHSRLLREVREELAAPLAKIFNKSLESMTVPNEWKTARISAIFKKGNKSLAGNYRPVSLTSVVGKGMERLVRDHLINHFERNNLFITKQYGFIGGRSTALQLLRVLDEWTEALDNGSDIDCVYMDYQKAFDTVPHNRLLKALLNSDHVTPIPFGHFAIVLTSWYRQLPRLCRKDLRKAIMTSWDTWRFPAELG